MIPHTVITIDCTGSLSIQSSDRSATIVQFYSEEENIALNSLPDNLKDLIKRFLTLL